MHQVKPRSTSRAVIGRALSVGAMVLAMAKDRGLSPRVAWVTSIAAGIVACAPTVKPPSPPAEPGPVAKLEKPHGQPPGRQVVVGEMCPQAAAGRPAVAPLI